MTENDRRLDVKQKLIQEVIIAAEHGFLTTDCVRDHVMPVLQRISELKALDLLDDEDIDLGTAAKKKHSSFLGFWVFFRGSASQKEPIHWCPLQAGLRTTTPFPVSSTEEELLDEVTEVEDPEFLMLANLTTVLISLRALEAFWTLRKELKEAQGASALDVILNIKRKHRELWPSVVNLPYYSEDFFPEDLEEMSATLERVNWM
jgi:hypothetical protein